MPSEEVKNLLANLPKEKKMRIIKTHAQKPKSTEVKVGQIEVDQDPTEKTVVVNSEPVIVPEPAKVEEVPLTNEKVTKIDELKEQKIQKHIQAIQLGKEMRTSKDALVALGIDRALVDEHYDKEPKTAKLEPKKSEELKPLILDDESVVPTVEDEITPEEKKVEETRGIYLKEYFKCKEIAKKKSSILDVFDGKKKRERKEQEYLTQEYKDAKEAYDKARVEMGNSLFDKKKSELMAGGVYGPELEAKLKEYKATKILYKTIIGEGDILARRKAEGTPVNVSKFKQALNWYVKLPRHKKLLLSTGIFMAAGTIAAGGATVSLLGVGLTRFARGMASGFISSIMTKLVDVYNRKGNNEFEVARDNKRSELTDKFGSGTITQEEYEKGISDIDKSGRDRKHKQALAKLGVGVIFGAGLGYASSHIGSIGGGHEENIPGTKEMPVIKLKPIDWVKEQPGFSEDDMDKLRDHYDSVRNSHNPVIDNPDHNTLNPETTDPTIEPEEPKPVDGTQDETPPPTPDADTPEASKVVTEVGKGHGAIKTLEEFQEKLRAQYPDPSKAPVSVQHILNTKPDRLAIEYGMFKPGDDAESAIMKLGSKFESDAQGNISFTQEGKTTILEKGDDADVTNVYGGKMIDGDRSGQARIISEQRGSGTSKFLEENPQKDPVGAVDGSAPKVNDGTSEFLKNNPQKDPAGLKPVTEPVQGITTPKVEDIKSNLTSGRLDDISPTKNVFDNSYGTNTETISPTRGVYNTGAGNSTSPNFASNREVVGNGFTTPNPMTNVAQAEQEMLDRQSVSVDENEPRVRTGNVIENQAPTRVSINEDPRHVASLAEAKDTFGRINMEIDKPEGDMTNGIKHTTWNKATDNMFKVKSVKFDSYENYEKEDELQRLLGSAKQEVKYVQSLDKNAQVVNMDYFREEPTWKTISKIPAKYFFNFDDAKFTDGTSIPKADLDVLVDKGILVEKVNVAPGQATTISYSFKNSDELERISKVYEKVISDEDVKLGNSKPIGDENLDKYVGRMTKRVYTADDGTMFAPKDQFIPAKAVAPTATTSDGYETMRAERSYRSNTYNNNGTGVISPRSGASGYQTSSDYSLANRIVDNIMRRRR